MVPPAPSDLVKTTFRHISQSLVRLAPTTWYSALEQHQKLEYSKVYITGATLIMIEYQMIF